jgi:hypothetical protein
VLLKEDYTARRTARPRAIISWAHFTKDWTMLRLITAATLLLAAAPAMAQYVATPYGNNGILLQPNNNGQTLGYQGSPPPQPSFVIPNAQLQQQTRPNFCGNFSNAYGQLHC